jgi:Spy/CpxP family protein refolding chaperone
MKRILLPTVLLAAATVSAAASAQDTTPTANGERFIQRIEARLNVTPEQIAQAKAILQQEKPTLETIHVQLAAEHAELVKQTTFNEAQTAAIVAKYADANTAAIIEREKLRVELTAILTPAQQEKLDQLRAWVGAAIDERLLTLGDNL